MFYFVQGLQYDFGVLVVVVGLGYVCYGEEYFVVECEIGVVVGSCKGCQFVDFLCQVGVVGLEVLGKIVIGFVGYLYIFFIIILDRWLFVYCYGLCDSCGWWFRF